jgi:iron complex outermembrane receptor protein
MAIFAKPYRDVSLLLIAASISLTAPVRATDEDRLQLETFIASATATENAGTLWPGSRTSGSATGIPQDILDLPRSITMISPEHLRLSGVQDFGGLDRLSPGAERPNYYGLAGSPVLRGDLASTFFNGIQRAFQRNEMLMSFGSLEGMDVVRGPAPAHFGPTQAGGYVNFLPKSPYYDRPRGSLRLTVGSHDLARVQIDQGAPFMAGSKPAAYRISVTGQNANAYHRNVRNDFVSVFGTVTIRWKERVTLQTGAEFYRYLTNENAGWNRVTQALIDDSIYIVGEPVDRTSAAAGGRVLPADIHFVVVPSEPGNQPSSAAAALIPPPSFSGTLPDHLRQLLGPNGEYTAAYLNADGPVATVRLNPRAVLADPDDRSHASNLLWFADWINRARPGTTLSVKTLVDWVKTTKYSSYGYALDMDQRIAEVKAVIAHEAVGGLQQVTYGASLRASSADELVDFQSEPFSRRDLSRPEPSLNSIVLAGAQRPLQGDTRNLWSRGLSSSLGQAALFASARWSPVEKAGIDLSARVEGARFTARVPFDQERNPLRGKRVASGGKNFTHFGVNPYWKPSARSLIYAALQQGTALNPAQAGNVSSEANFGRTELAEVGGKTSLANEAVFISAALYHSRLSRFNNITSNPYGLRSKGAELEVAWRPSSRVELLAHASIRRTVQTNLPGFRFQATQDYYLPLVAGGLYAGGSANAMLLAANNPTRRFPGSPEQSAHVQARIRLTDKVSFNVGPVFRSSFWLNFEHTLRVPSAVMWNGGLDYRHGAFAARLDATNLFSERTFLGSDPNFASNAIVTPAAPLEYRLSVEWKF